MRRSEFKRKIKDINDEMEKEKAKKTGLFKWVIFDLPLKQAKTVKYRENYVGPTFTDEVTDANGCLIATLPDDGSYQVSDRFNKIPEKFRKELLKVFDEYSSSNGYVRNGDSETLVTIRNDSERIIFLQQEIDALKERVKDLENEAK